MAKRQEQKTVRRKSDKVMGTGSFVEFLRPHQTLAEREAERQELAERGVMFDAAGNVSGGDFGPEELTRLSQEKVAGALVSWDWVDNEGNPLPQPDIYNIDGTVAMFIEYLLGIEMDWLTQEYAKLVETPGNSARSSRS